ncbi:MAG: hypothetical protein WC716_16780, partial [Chitinophagaceae bacterium]
LLPCFFYNHFLCQGRNNGHPVFHLWHAAFHRRDGITDIKEYFYIAFLLHHLYYISEMIDNRTDIERIRSWHSKRNLQSYGMIVSSMFLSMSQQKKILHLHLHPAMLKFFPMNPQQEKNVTIGINVAAQST